MMLTDTQIDTKIREAGLLGISAEENITPELINDAINGTLEMYENIDIAALATKIATRKAEINISGNKS